MIADRQDADDDEFIGLESFQLKEIMCRGRLSPVAVCISVAKGSRKFRG